MTIAEIKLTEGESAHIVEVAAALNVTVEQYLWFSVHTMNKATSPEDPPRADMSEVTRRWAELKLENRFASAYEDLEDIYADDPASS